MQELERVTYSENTAPTSNLPVSVIIATRNEAHNLPRCLAALSGLGLGEIYVVDSQSTDETVEIARTHAAQVVQFYYQGGWPKKRQWALNTLPLTHDWVLLLDADEIVTPQLSEEISHAIQDSRFDGYYISLRMSFLARALRHGNASFWKLSLFRRGKGHYECRLRGQDASMADMEVHEHVLVDGSTAKLKNPIIHYNVESLSRYIQKHDEYSNWEAKVWLNKEADKDELRPTFFGQQAQRRRWLKQKFLRIPGSPLLFFFYKYVFRLGFLDGIAGLIYCGFQGIQFFHIKAKIYELRLKRGEE
ncbi:MAG: glycosyltransferase [Acidobacteria bacterium]|nr:MAG: glycosyltransferase [Acidobacteriota bacterium]